MTLEIIVLIGLLLLSGFFSSAETAYLSLERVQVEHLVRAGAPGAANVAALLATPRRLLSAILVGNNLTNTGAAAVGTLIASEVVSPGAGVVAATIVVTVLLVVFGEVGPKTVALQHASGLARHYARPMQAWSWLIRPLVAVLDRLSSLLLRLLGAVGDERKALSLGELHTAIQVGTEEGEIEAPQSEMLLGALTLQDTPVRHVMTPRVRVLTADASDPIADVTARLLDAGVLRLPVVDGSIDRIVGHVHLRDLAGAHLRAEADEPVGTIARPVPFESERASVARALQLIRQSGVQLLILVDEYGLTSGIVTLEDLAEEVVGEVRSESPGSEPIVAGFLGDTMEVDGQYALSDLSDVLGAEMAHAEAETAGGLVAALLSRLPGEGDYVDYAGYRFVVTEASVNRVLRVSVTARPAPDPETGDADTVGDSQGDAE